MSKYEELRKGYAEAKRADQEYWVSLRQLVRQIRNGFCQYLGVSTDAQVTIDGREIPVVAAGKMIDSEFRGVALDKLEQCNESLNFSLQVILDSETYGAPKNIATFHLSVFKNGDGFHVQEVSGWEPKLFLIPPLTEFYDHLYSEILSGLSIKR